LKWRVYPPVVKYLLQLWQSVCGLSVML
jgi:hypothetical protein